VSDDDRRVTRLKSSSVVRFAQKLPEQYKLLRRKLFRIPQWTSSSDSDSDADANSKSVQGPDPPTLFNPHANAANAKRDAAQSRSRSLSVSLEQEAAAGMRRTESKPRRVLQREVSMSKVFKNRRNDGPNAPPPPPPPPPVKVEVEAASGGSQSLAAGTQAPAKGPVVLVEGTPQKPKAKSSKSAQGQRKGRS
jgi:hypothetical protein